MLLIRSFPLCFSFNHSPSNACWEHHFFLHHSTMHLRFFSSLRTVPQSWLQWKLWPKVPLENDCNLNPKKHNIKRSQKHGPRWCRFHWSQSLSWTHGTKYGFTQTILSSISAVVFLRQLFSLLSRVIIFFTCKASSRNKELDILWYCSF